MANEEQVKILKQGVEVWNQWRKEHPGEKINLREAKLQGATLKEADLQGADLMRADLSGARLQGVKLWRARLQGATLKEADLQGADLMRADLSDANLQDVKLWRATLQNADLQGADLMGVTLQGADLVGANLVRVTLQGANLVRANLVKVTLQGAKLWEADLQGADLQGANLQGADLHTTRLITTNLTQAILTGAYLYGTARDDWTIDGVTCDYVYWDKKPYFYGEDMEKQVKQWEQAHRVPKDRDFRPGEFEELYKHLPTFEYVFEHGFTALDAVVMSRIVEAINEKHPEFELRLDSFHSRGQPHAKFTVLHKKVVKEAHKQITDGYESRMKTLEGQMEEIQKRLAILGDQPKMLINNLTISGGNVTMGDKGDQYNISGGQQGAVGRNAQATGNTFQQLLTIADDLSTLKNDMRNKAQSPDQEASVEEVERAEQAAREGDEPTMMGHLKKAGRWALEAAKEVGTDVAAEVIKKSLGV